MAQVPVDIRVDIDGLGAFRKLEKSFQRLDKMAQDMRVQLKSRRAERQLKGLTRGVDQLEKKASDIDVKFDVDDRGLKRAERRLRALGKNVRANVDVAGGSAGDAGSSAGLLGAVGLLGATGQLDKLTGSIARNQKNIADRVEEATALRKQEEDLTQAIADNTRRVSVTEGQVTRLTNRNKSIRQKNKKLTEAQVKELIDAKELVKQNKTEAKRLAKEFTRVQKLTAQYNRNLDRGGKLLDKQQKSAKRIKGLGGAVKGGAAGAAFSNLPGSGYAGAAGAGALVGGPLGAVAAVAVKGLLDASAAMGQFAVESTKAAAEIRRLEIALTGVVGDQTPAALAAIKRSVEDFNTPLQASTRNFTQLAAATSAAGFSVAETEEVYRGLAAANKALGGDAQKLEGIMLATTQVFSKGKVTAEELRGQIGERLPGAVSLFAQATGRTTAELDQALQKGEVSLDDFLKFTKKLFEDYEDQAKKIASGPEEAGARLKVALENLGNSMGTLLAPIGAAFQDLFTEIVKAANEFAKTLNAIFGVGSEGAYQKAKRRFDVAFEQVQRLQNGTAGRSDLGFGLEAANRELEAARKNLQAIQAENRKRAGFGIEVDLTKSQGTDTTTKGATKGQVDNLKERLRLSEQAADIAVQELEAATAVGDIEKLRADAAVDILQLGYDRINALEAETDAQVRRNINDQFDAKLLERNLQLTKDIAAARAKAAEGLFQPREATALEEYISKTQTELNDTDARIASIAETIETELATAMADAFVGFIDGTKSAQEAAADMFKNIGRSFIEMATAMIAKAIILKALGVPLSGGGSALTFNVPGAGTAKGFFPLGKDFEGGGYTGSGPRAGGVDGKGGFPAILHPDETVIDHREPMGRYNAGGGGAGGGGGPVNVHYDGPTLNFNSEDYVPASAVPGIINAAAQQGAAGGESKVMSSLRNRRSARSRIGLR